MKNLVCLIQGKRCQLGVSFLAHSKAETAVVYFFYMASFYHGPLVSVLEQLSQDSKLVVLSCCLGQS